MQVLRFYINKTTDNHLPLRTTTILETGCPWATVSKCDLSITAMGGQLYHAVSTLPGLPMLWEWGQAVPHPPPAPPNRGRLPLQLWTYLMVSRDVAILAVAVEGLLTCASYPHLDHTLRTDQVGVEIIRTCSNRSKIIAQLLPYNTT